MFKSTYHNPGACLCPDMMTRLLCVMMTCVALSIASHPWSHSNPTLINAFAASAGNKCAVVAALGSPGIVRLAVCVDVMCSPLGICTHSGRVVGCILLHVVLSRR